MRASLFQSLSRASASPPSAYAHASLPFARREEAEAAEARLRPHDATQNRARRAPPGAKPLPTEDDEHFHSPRDFPTSPRLPLLLTASSVADNTPLSVAAARPLPASCSLLRHFLPTQARRGGRPPSSVDGEGGGLCGARDAAASEKEYARQAGGGLDSAADSVATGVSRFGRNETLNPSQGRQHGGSESDARRSRYGENGAQVKTLQTRTQFRSASRRLPSSKRAPPLLSELDREGRREKVATGTAPDVCRDDAHPARAESVSYPSQASEAGRAKTRMKAEELPPLSGRREREAAPADGREARSEPDERRRPEARSQSPAAPKTDARRVAASFLPRVALLGAAKSLQMRERREIERAEKGDAPVLLENFESLATHASLARRRLAGSPIPDTQRALNRRGLVSSAASPAPPSACLASSSSRRALPALAGLAARRRAAVRPRCFSSSLRDVPSRAAASVCASSLPSAAASSSASTRSSSHVRGSARRFVSSSSCRGAVSIGAASPHPAAGEPRLRLDREAASKRDSRRLRPVVPLSARAAVTQRTAGGGEAAVLASAPKDRQAAAAGARSQALQRAEEKASPEAEKEGDFSFFSYFTRGRECPPADGLPSREAPRDTHADEAGSEQEDRWRDSTVSTADEAKPFDSRRDPRRREPVVTSASSPVALVPPRSAEGDARDAKRDAGQRGEGKRRARDSRQTNGDGAHGFPPLSREGDSGGGAADRQPRERPPRAGRGTARETAEAAARIGEQPAGRGVAATEAEGDENDAKKRELEKPPQSTPRFGEQQSAMLERQATLGREEETEEEKARQGAEHCGGGWRPPSAVPGLYPSQPSHAAQETGKRGSSETPPSAAARPRYSARIPRSIRSLVAERELGARSLKKLTSATFSAASSSSAGPAHAAADDSAEGTRAAPLEHFGGDTRAEDPRWPGGLGESRAEARAQKKRRRSPCRRGRDTDGARGGSSLAFAAPVASASSAATPAPPPQGDSENGRPRIAVESKQKQEETKGRRGETREEVGNRKEAKTRAPTNSRVSLSHAGTRPEAEVSHSHKVTSSTAHARAPPLPPQTCARPSPRQAGGVQTAGRDSHSSLRVAGEETRSGDTRRRESSLTSAPLHARRRSSCGSSASSGSAAAAARGSRPCAPGGLPPLPSRGRRASQQRAPPAADRRASASVASSSPQPFAASSQDRSASLSGALASAAGSLPHNVSYFEWLAHSRFEASSSRGAAAAKAREDTTEGSEPGGLSTGSDAERGVRPGASVLRGGDAGRRGDGAHASADSREGAREGTEDGEDALGEKEIEDDGVCESADRAGGRTEPRIEDFCADSEVPIGCGRTGTVHRARCIGGPLLQRLLAFRYGGAVDESAISSPSPDALGEQTECICEGDDAAGDRANRGCGAGTREAPTEGASSRDAVAAIKVLSKATISQMRIRDQIKKERDIHLRLEHPNIVRFFSSFEDRQKLYFVLELANGGTLRDRLNRCRRMSEPEAAHLIFQLVDALCYLHARGIVHRDLKPENLLLHFEVEERKAGDLERRPLRASVEGGGAGESLLRDPLRSSPVRRSRSLYRFGQLKIADFGFACYCTSPPPSREQSFIDRRPSAALSPTASSFLAGLSTTHKRTTFCGTATYLAPEIVRKEPYDRKVDLWCLGVCLYELLMGRPPFVGDSKEALFSQICDVTDLPFARDISAEGRALICRLCSKQPEARPGAEEVLDDPWFLRYLGEEAHTKPERREAF
ncbi:hypothetical protein BESB_044530 [Besnoitia besnoiti]|uniref:Protein kinase domain-containing protein n=1 Tax=Besnoitia besnoiti TaxID=94643 RepID=A0A2A9MJ32_BESBE|nr:hypothetical protein BESB_044530 [Besnoitia besnoiti]PFH36261.1 hypothetical protein BESB_044530 [Besnoitia besnoiti]